VDGCYVWDELEDRLDEWMDYTVKWIYGWIGSIVRTDCMNGLGGSIGWLDRIFGLDG
jgi:hypothetical protein